MRVEYRFDDLLMAIAAATGANLEKHSVTKKAKNKDGSKKTTQHGRQIYTEKKEMLTGSAPLKGAERIDQKVEQEYGTHSKVLDVVRGTIAYDSCSQLMVGLKFNVAVEGHICEMQFNLVSMLKAKSTKQGYGAYEAMRDLETAWIQEHPDAQKMPDIDELTAMADDDHPDVRNIVGVLRRAIHASHLAYGNAAREISKDPDFDKMLEVAEGLAGEVSVEDYQQAADFEQ